MTLASPMGKTSHCKCKYTAVELRKYLIHCCLFGWSGICHVAYVITCVYVIEVNGVIWFQCEMSGCLNKRFAEGLFWLEII